MILSRLKIIHRTVVSHLRVLNEEKLNLHNRCRYTPNVYSWPRISLQYACVHVPRVMNDGQIHSSPECLFRRLSTKSLWASKQLVVPSTHERRNISIVTWLAAKPVLMVVAIIVGRIIRRKYWALSPAERQLFKYTIQKNRNILSAVSAFSAIVVFIYCRSHIEDTPITGRKRFMSLTHEHAKEFAIFQKDMLVTLFKEHFISADDARLQRAASVVRKIIDTNPDITNVLTTWTIYAVDEDSVNAFVLPTGHIFVFSGMLKLCATDDQLATILGHEIAHAVLQHHREEISRSVFADWFVIIGLACIWCFLRSGLLALLNTLVLAKTVSLLVRLPSSRQQEWEADHVGLIFAANACYDVREAGLLWRKMSEEEDSPFSTPIWMGTHPDSLKRAEFLDSLLQDAEGWRKANGCPPLAGPEKTP